jgi:hypothetical protein
MCCSASTATGALFRVTDDLRVTTLVDSFEGKRLNAPNDLVYRTDGTLFFTDPPYGLPRQDDDPEKDLPFNGVFKLVNGKAEVIIKDLTRPERHRVFAGRANVVRVQLGRHAPHLDALSTSCHPATRRTAVSFSIQRRMKTAACRTE